MTTAPRVLFRCDQAEVPVQLARQRWDEQNVINRRGLAANLNLRAENLAGTLLPQIEDRAADLVYIAAYVYAADQMFSRGGLADASDKRWRRSLALCIPVSDPDFWMRYAIREQLAEVLGFLTEDAWEFAFSAAPHEACQLPLTLDEVAVREYPDSVLLFSGGADSLCAAIESVVVRGERPVLVSHRPATHLDSRQKRLADELKRRFPQWAFPHISFGIHRMKSDASERTQRSRAFLFAALGAAVAGQLGLSRITLADNGIVSLNLPISRQLVGALASRSTHPKFLRAFSDLITLVLSRPVEVANLLWARTRADALAILHETDARELLQETNSCSRTRGRPLATPHCGYCSQCVDRRFGTMAAGLDDYDLAERYGLDIFTQELSEGEARTVALSYVKFARLIRRLSDDALFNEFPQLHDGYLPDDPAAHQVAEELIAMVRRHAETVLRVLDQMIAAHSSPLAREELPPHCLLRLATGSVTRSAAAPAEQRNVFQLRGHVWMIAFRGQTIQLRDSIGLRYLAHLLGHPGRDYPARELVATVASEMSRRQAEQVPRIREQQAIAEALRETSQAPADHVVDAQTVRECQVRMKALEFEARQADRDQDREAARRARDEIARIRMYLSASQALGGRPRTFSNENERARKSVSKAINVSLKAISSSHPDLGEHLDSALRIGSTCLYRPDPSAAWLT